MLRDLSGVILNNIEFILASELSNTKSNNLADFRLMSGSGYFMYHQAQGL